MRFAVDSSGATAESRQVVAVGSPLTVGSSNQVKALSVKTRWLDYQW